MVEFLGPFPRDFLEACDASKVAKYFGEDGKLWVFAFGFEGQEFGADKFAASDR